MRNIVNIKYISIVRKKTKNSTGNIKENFRHGAW